MSPFSRKFTDEGDDSLTIESGGTIRPSAWLCTDGTVIIDAHRLAEVTAALYEAAGQPVPHLPVIADPEQAEALAGDLGIALHGLATPGYEAAARVLLAAGWRKP